MMSLLLLPAVFCVLVDCVTFHWMLFVTVPRQLYSCIHAELEVGSSRAVHPFLIHTFGDCLCAHMHLDVLLIHLDCSHGGISASIDKYVGA